MDRGYWVCYRLVSKLRLHDWGCMGQKLACIGKIYKFLVKCLKFFLKGSWKSVQVAYKVFGGMLQWYNWKKKIDVWKNDLEL
jgi:hypothetical protein